MIDATAQDFHHHAYDLHRQGRAADAVPYYQKAIDLDPSYRDAWCNLGLALLNQRRPEEALTCQRQALALDPESAEAHNNIGIIHSRNGHIAEAESCFRAALRLQPHHANATLNLGAMLQHHNHIGEAEVMFRQALALGVDPAGAHTNLALVMMEQGRPADAEWHCRQALAAVPGHPMARANLALALLATGQFAEGWREYEARWAVEASVEAMAGAPLPAMAQPQWTGQRLHGETVFIWAEQGFGDVLQFCRYVPMVARAGGRVVLMAPKALHRVLATLDGVTILLSEEDAVPGFDYHCPLLSLPLAFGTEVESIPAPASYLAADPAAWADVLAAMPGLKVGLAWAGKSRTEHPHAVAIDKRRSMRLADMMPLLSVEGCSFVSLQLGPPARQMRALSVLQDWPMLRDVSDRLVDWADTAALIAGLDVVITVDTAVAHLAGALGKPVWMLNRFDSCWRWFRDRDDTPWYPSMWQFRQTRAGDWVGVVERVAEALAAWVPAV
jgi:Flp pilus assembly protein TadD